MHCAPELCRGETAIIFFVHLSPRLSHWLQQTTQDVPVHVLVDGLALWQEFCMHDAPHTKETINITLIFDFAILAFFGPCNVGLFHWRLWRLVSGSYSKIYDLSPVITLSSKFDLVSSCSRMTWHTYTRLLFLLLFEQLRNHFRTDLLPHPQIFRNDCPHPLAVHAKLICNHSNSQAATSMHLLMDKLDIFLGPACGRPTAPGVIVRIPPSLLKPLVALEGPSSRDCVIPIHIVQQSGCFCWSFSKPNKKFQVGSLFGGQSVTAKIAGLNFSQRPMSD